VTDLDPVVATELTPGVFAIHSVHAHLAALT
jgi:hypothetical protein